MSDSTISDENLYEELSDTELADINTGELLNLLTYADAAASGLPVENPPMVGNDGDGNNTEEPRFVPAHHGRFLSNLEHEHFHPMNVTPDRPWSAYFYISNEFTSKDIFDSLQGDGISVVAVRCLQRKLSGDVLITFSNPEHCLRFIECSWLIIRCGNVCYSTHPVSGELTYLTVYDAPFEMPDSAIIKWLAPDCKVYSSCLGKLQQYPDVYNGIWHYRVALKQSIPCYLRFGCFQVRFYHKDQVKTCCKCGTHLHVARDCNNEVRFNCDEIGHTSKNCPEKTKCCICKSEAHMVIDCDYSRYRRPVLNPNARPRSDERLNSPAHLAKQETTEAHAESQVKSTAQALSYLAHVTPEQHSEPQDDLSAQAQPGLPHGSASVHMDVDPNSTGDPTQPSEASGAALDSQGFLISQPTPAGLPTRPTNVCPSTPEISLSVDLCITDDESSENEGNSEITGHTTTSSPSGEFVFAESIRLAAVAKSLKLHMGDSGAVLQLSCCPRLSHPCESD